MSKETEMISLLLTLKEDILFDVAIKSTDTFKIVHNDRGYHYEYNSTTGANQETSKEAIVAYLVSNIQRPEKR